MTISEQIREAALYAREPWLEMNGWSFDACCRHKSDGQSLYGMPDTDLRTFMLLVAEALE